jgi:hypothetical protein
MFQVIHQGLVPTLPVQDLSSKMVFNGIKAAEVSVIQSTRIICA